MATEQQYQHIPKGPKTNSEKLDFATSSLLERLARIGISLERQAAEERIEAAVFRLRGTR